LRVPANPFDPTNRRVSLIVQWQEASASAASGGKLPGDANNGTAGANATPEGSPQNTTSMPHLSVTKPAGDVSKSSTIAKPAAGTPVKPAAKSAWVDRLKFLIPAKQQHL
jgi:hypothetical protein